MVDKNTDFFKYVDNFAKTTNIPSIPIIKSKLDFVPKVTIAIPTFKRAALLKEAIDSAINQTDYIEYDIIVVDNNPERKCETERLLSSYNNPRISYYKNAENIQMAGNWNRLFTLAIGEYIVMLHDDDFIYPDFLVSLDKIINNCKEKFDAFYPPYLTYNMKIRNQEPQRKENSRFWGMQLKIEDFLWGNVVGPPLGICIRRLAILDIGGFDNNHYPSIDYDFYIKFTSKYKACKIFGHPLSLYRILENESCKTETLLNFVTNDVEIKKKILSLNNNKIKNKIWEKYINVFNYKYLSNGIKIFKNNSINIKSQSSVILFKYNIIDITIYHIMNVYRNLNFRKRKFKL